MEHIVDEIVIKHTFFHLRSAEEDAEVLPIRPRSFSDSWLDGMKGEIDLPAGKCMSDNGDDVDTDIASVAGTELTFLTTSDGEDSQLCSGCRSPREWAAAEDETSESFELTCVEQQAWTPVFIWQCVPEQMLMHATMAPADNHSTQSDVKSTVILRNIPNNFTREAFLGVLDRNGFSGMYDFLYLPIDFNSNANLGYAFINLVSAEATDAFWNFFDGYTWDCPSEKVCNVVWCGTHQGREAHVNRYRNSPMMHPSVPESARPMLFLNGKQVPFPAPTKTIRPPHKKTTNSSAHKKKQSKK
jgi:hypothetical protein